VNQPPPNNAVCEREGCNASAAGFVVFETGPAGAKSIFPYEWRCAEHAHARVLAHDLSRQTKARVLEEFEKRLGKDARRTITAGLSDLSENEVEDLRMLVGHTPIGVKPKMTPFDGPVDIITGKDFREKYTLDEDGIIKEKS
jgi:hypothetical protein